MMMACWPRITLMLSLLVAGLMQGCELGWDFLKEGGGGDGGGANAQTACQGSRVVVGQFPPTGGLFDVDGSVRSFSATYSSPSFSGPIPSIPPPLALRISRHRLWLNDLSVEVSFFPFDDTERDPRNGCLGRAILEINIPFERLFFDNSSISISSTRISQTEPSAFYAEGGDPGFTASAVNGTVRLRSVDGIRVEVIFDFTFNPGADQRRLTNGEAVAIEDDIDQNPAAEGVQSG